jgi:alkanesulfonate monooxygenase SsuD/methylene tetrahydromethanopterin reductase-like flavin-dependent oxidoreductase (luciferase family)
MLIGTRNFPVRRLAGDDRPLSQLYRAAVESAVAIEAAGFDFFLAGEHHFMPTQWNPSPILVLTAMAQHTTRLRLGTNVLLTPFYEPVRLSEDLATLDLLSNGRLDAVFGSGSIRFEFETYRVDPKERFGRMWETIEIVRRSFAEEEFDHEGRYFRIPHLRQTTRPVQEPFPIWFSGFGPQVLERAGREGYHLLGGGGPHLERYYAGLERGGRSIDDVNFGLMSPPLYLVENDSEIPATRERAQAEAAARAAEYSEQGRDIAFGTPQASEAQRAARDEPIVGRPDQVLEALAQRYEGSRITHLIVQGDARQLQLIGAEMLPTMRAWGRDPVGSTPR